MWSRRGLLTARAPSQYNFGREACLCVLPSSTVCSQLTATRSQREKSVGISQCAVWYDDCRLACDNLFPPQILSLLRAHGVSPRAGAVQLGAGAALPRRRPARASAPGRGSAERAPEASDCWRFVRTCPNAATHPSSACARRRGRAVAPRRPASAPRRGGTCEGAAEGERLDGARHSGRTHRKTPGPSNMALLFAGAVAGWLAGEKARG